MRFPSRHRRCRRYRISSMDIRTAKVLAALGWEALRGYLKQMRTRELERRDREGYLRHPDTEDELTGWEEEVAWPED